MDVADDVDDHDANVEMIYAPILDAQSIEDDPILVPKVY